MPFVNIKITSGPEVTPAAKAELVARVTLALVDVLHKKPEETHIVIEEVALENWGFKGKLAAELRKTTQG